MSPGRLRAHAGRPFVAAASAVLLTALVALTACDNEVIGRTADVSHGGAGASGSQAASASPAASTAAAVAIAAATAPAATPGSPVETATPAEVGTALATLEELPVRGRAPMTGYGRDQFGQEWSDAAGDSEWTRNGCDTRNDLLARDLQRKAVESNGCVVDSGVLAYEPFSGAKSYPFDKHDNDYATDLDAEHIVALGNAWVTGAQQIGEDQRAALANDPINLMLVDPSLNRQKGDADFAAWLPPNKPFRCSYAARQIRVKVKYHLWVTAPEKAAMLRVLGSCPSEPLDQPEPQDGYRAVDPERADDPAPTGQANVAAEPVSAADSGGDDLYFANCTAVRAAGAAPIHRGDPGYDSHLDRDGDGVGCE